MLGKSRLFVVVIAPIMAAMGVSLAADLPPATGPVILTISGNIEQTNRPPFDEFEDVLTYFHERSFDKAVEFDRAMLEALGTHEVEVNYEEWPTTFRFEGPYLSDVLELVGANPTMLTVVALDLFASEISKEDLGSHDWIVALKRDGEYLRLGQHGPVWVVFDPGPDKEITAEEEGTWPWAAFYIEVE